MEIDAAVRASSDGRLRAKYDNAVYVVQRAFALYPYAPTPHIYSPPGIHSICTSSVLLLPWPVHPPGTGESGIRLFAARLGLARSAIASGGEAAGGSVDRSGGEMGAGG
jgi:hypothetical protein